MLSSVSSLHLAISKTRKKTVRKKAAGAASRKAAGKKPETRKQVRRKPAAGTTSRGRVKLEDVVLGVIAKNKGPISFKDLCSIITGKKLFKTKSKNFDNVLRRTLSTSKAIKRVGRGVYDAS